MQRWSPDFQAAEHVIRSTVVWVRLPGIHLRYYHKSVLRRVGMLLGEVIKIDYSTESATRGKFARLAVEVDLTQPLISQILVDGCLVLVEYEGLPDICFRCGKYGHLLPACPTSPPPEVDPAPADQPLPEHSTNPRPSPVLAPPSASSQPSYGPWMIAQRSARPRRQAPASSRGGAPDLTGKAAQRSGTRFEVLASDDANGREQDLTAPPVPSLHSPPVRSTSTVRSLQRQPRRPGASPPNVSHARPRNRAFPAFLPQAPPAAPETPCVAGPRGPQASFRPEPVRSDPVQPAQVHPDLVHSAPVHPDLVRPDQVHPAPPRTQPAPPNPVRPTPSRLNPLHHSVTHVSSSSLAPVIHPAAIPSPIPSHEYSTNAIPPEPDPPVPQSGPDPPPLPPSSSDPASLPVAMAPESLASSPLPDAVYSGCDARAPGPNSPLDEPMSPADVTDPTELVASPLGEASEPMVT